MPTPAEASAQFRKAIELGDAEAAIEAARTMAYVGIGDSLDLVRLLARARDPRFDRAASRWVARWVVDKGGSVGDASVAFAAMGGLALDPGSESAQEALRAVARSD